MSRSPARFNCQQCTVLLTPKVTVSDKNGNKGRFFISCSGTLENPHSNFFCFVEDPRPSPTSQAPRIFHDTNQQPLLMNGVGSRSFVEPGRCAASGCTKLRINIKCTRRACATHCRAMGGCSVNLHQPAGTMSMPSRSQSFETAYMLSRSQPPLASCSPSTPAITLLHNSPPLPPLSFSPTQIPGPSSNEARQPPSSVQFSQAPPLPAASSRMPAQIIAEPPSSMNPLPDPRFASQMRPIFTTQALREQEMREDARTMDEQRLNGAKKVKHTVTLCAWLSDNDGPEESVHQGGFVWPNFCLSSKVLTDAGFPTPNENTWYHLYNRSRRSWQRVKVDYFLSVDTSAEILIKAIDVKACSRLDDYLTSGTKAVEPPHFRNNLRGERASVKAKIDREFLELSSQSKRAHKVVPASSHPSSSRATSSIHTTSIRQSRSPSKAISVSSSSPSPVPAVPHSRHDIIDITDSDMSDTYCKPPTKRRKAGTSADNHSKTTLRTVIKQEQHILPLAPTAVPAKERQWPSEFPVLDVVHVLHSCKPSPLGTTVARHFSFLTGLPFKSSTYYNAWDKWDHATQEQRDGVEGCGDDDLWEDFAIQVPLEKTKLKVARQRVRRRQCTVEAEDAEPEQSDGGMDSNMSSASFDSFSSN